MPACARCSVSRGISFSGEPSRSRAFLKARADKEEPVLRGNAFSSEPSRPRAFLKAPSDKNVRAHAYYKEALPRAAPLAQEPFSKNALTKKSRLAHSFILRGSAFSGEPSRTRAFFKALLDKEAPALAFMSCSGAKLSRATPLAKEPFSKHPRTRVLARTFTHIAAKCFLEQLLSHNKLSPGTLGQRGDSACAQSFTLQGFLELPLSHGRLSQGPLGKIV